MWIYAGVIKIRLVYLQSWGQEYYIKYSDFIEYNVFYGDANGFVVVID